MLKITKAGLKEIGYDIKDEAKLAALFGIGNGYYGIRGSLEEFGDVFIQGCYVRGVFDQIVEIPNAFADNLYMKKYYFDLQKLKEFEKEDSTSIFFRLFSAAPTTLIHPFGSARFSGTGIFTLPLR